MLTYSFILGRNQALSVAEIFSVLKTKSIEYEFLAVSGEVLLIGTKTALLAKELQLQLGGTIKIVEVIKELDLDKSEEEFHALFSADSLFNHFFLQNQGKIRFGVSLYHLIPVKSDERGETKMLEHISKMIKMALKSAGQSSGFVRMKGRYLSSVSVAKNGLLKKGAEIILLLNQHKIYVGKTLTVQQFEEYSFRDYGRPERDARQGMLPPKLAKIMLNMAAAPKHASILDPFCGSGTVLTEAIVLGYTNLFGSDLSQKAVSDTEKNIAWLTEKYHLNANDLNIKLKACDISQLSSCFAANSIDAIVTEPFLGPPYTRNLGDEEINRLMRHISALYISAFAQFAKIFKNNGKIVIIFPAIKGQSRFRLLDILPDLQKSQFFQISYINDDLSKIFSPFLSERKTCIYGRGDEFILREILLFEYRKVKG